MGGASGPRLLDMMHESLRVGGVSGPRLLGVMHESLRVGGASGPRLLGVMFIIPGRRPKAPPTFSFRVPSFTDQLAFYIGSPDPDVKPETWNVERIFDIPRPSP